MNKVIILFLSIMLSCTAQGQHWQPLLFGPENGLTVTDSAKWTLLTFLNCSEQIQLYSVNRDSVDYLSTFFPHYFINNNQSNDKCDLVYSNVWPEIDAIFTSGKAGLALTFICRPGSNLNSIRFTFDEEDKLTIDNNGNLKLHNY